MNPTEHELYEHKINFPKPCSTVGRPLEKINSLLMLNVLKVLVEHIWVMCLGDHILLVIEFSTLRLLSMCLNVCVYRMSLTQM